MFRCLIVGLVIGLDAVCLASPPPELPTEQVDLEKFPLALNGFCPVTLTTERKWKRGDEKFGVLHRRRTFLFASEAEQTKFLKDPDRYTPVLTGCDIVTFVRTGRLVDGSPDHCTRFRGEVYLFADKASLEAFTENPTKFADDARQEILRQEGKKSIP